MERAFELAKLFTKIKKCERCPDLVKSRYKPTTGYGDAKIPIVFVGLAPAKEGHNISGIPFTRINGSLIPSGRAFVSALKLGYKLEDIYFTELVKCHPPRNRRPTDEEILNCEDYLLKEIAIVKPKVIVSLGKDVANYFAKRKTWEKLRIFPVYHPSYVHRFQKYNEYSEQFARLFELIKKELK